MIGHETPRHTRCPPFTPYRARRRCRNFEYSSIAHISQSLPFAVVPLTSLRASSFPHFGQDYRRVPASTIHSCGQCLASYAYLRPSIAQSTMLFSFLLLWLLVSLIVLLSLFPLSVSRCLYFFASL